MARPEVRRHSLLLSGLLALAKASIIVISIVMVAVTLSQVVFRYVLEEPLPWSEELARYCFVWIVFLGGAIGLERGVHLGVDLLVNLLPPSGRKAIELLTTAIIAGFAATIIYASIPVLNINMLQRSPAMGVQMAWIYIAIPISMGLIFLICIEKILKQLFAGSGREG